MENKINWKQVGIIGIIVYILSLPLMFWKSSKIGKIASIVILMMVLSTIIVSFTKKISEAYYSIDSVIQVDKKSKLVINEINQVFAQLNTFKQRIDKLELEFNKQITQNKETQVDKILRKSSQLEGEISTIERSVKALKTELRDSFLERILRLRENIFIKKYSTDSYEVRKELADLLETENLLSETEKERFYKELKSIGFDTIDQKKKVKETVPKFYTRKWNVSLAQKSESYDSWFIDFN